MHPVLLIDDEPHIIEALTMTVRWEKYGFYVSEVAADALSALELLRKRRFSLIITDIRMPHMDGIAFIKKIRETDVDNDTEIFIISGYNSFEYAKSAISLRVSSYVLKPIDPEEVEQLLAQTKPRVDQKMEKSALWSEKNDKPSEINEIIRFVNENFRKNITLKEISERFFMNTAYLGVKFKQATGFGFHYYINKLRIEYVKKQCAIRQCKMNELLEAAGFCNHQYFYKLFKKIEGVSFSDFITKR